MSQPYFKKKHGRESGRMGGFGKEIEEKEKV